MLIFLVKRFLFYNKLVFLSLTRGIHEETVPVSLRRVIVMLVLNVGGTLVFTINWICIWADDLFFPQYRNLTIKKPVFILGVPRSGSTLLLRLMARDEHNFTTFKLWEILFAPSIVQRKIFGSLGNLDRKTGGLLSGFIKRIDRRFFESSKPVHQVGLFLPEEDALVLIWIFSTFFLFFAYPFLDQFNAYLKFDGRMPEKEKKQIMQFYQNMVQRHLYHHGPEKRFLSKNPTFSPWAGALKQRFPDAVFLNTVRHPYQQIPSVISLIVYLTGKFGGNFLKTKNYRDLILDVIKVFYQHPVTQLKTMGKDGYAFILFEDLAADPDKIINKVYEKFELNLREDVQVLLQEKSVVAKKYKSRHRYSLSQFDLTTEKIFEEYKVVFKEFNFTSEETTERTG